MDDRAIIALYWDRDQQALVQSERKYGGYCYTVAHRILDDREDAEECVNDTWYQAWNAMPPHRPDFLRMFLAKITRSVAVNRLKALCARKRGGGQVALALEELAGCLAVETDVEDAVLARELGETIRRFVRDLPEREGDIFTRRYFFTESIREIALAYGLTVNNATVILSRTRKKLKQHLMKEGFFHESAGPF